MFKKNLKKKYKNLIFDFDDTLAPCGVFYVEATKKFCEFQHERLKVPINVIEKILHGIDLACIDLGDGFDRSRYPTSFAATSVALDIIQKQIPNEQAAETSFRIGDSVFDAPYDLYPNVVHFLTEYKSHHNIFLWTKGDAEIQKAKIERNSLQSIFGSACIHITMRKTPEGFAQLLKSHLLKPSETLMIGDSVKDDIGCALANSVDCVLVNSAHQKWGYENTNHKPTYVIKSIQDLPTIIPL